MAENTKIEWADHTFNPWEGCTKVSAGCANCYAEERSLRFGSVEWGPNGTRRVTSESNWSKPFAWNRKAIAEKRRYRVFCASLADVSEDWPGTMMGHDGRPLWHLYQPSGTWTTEPDGHADRVPVRMADVRARLFRMIQLTPNLDWLLLTKRPENIARMMPQHPSGGPWPNVWLGTSVENQATADERIPHLLRVPAAVRFLSCEPLLGPVQLTRIEMDFSHRRLVVDPLRGITPYRPEEPPPGGIHWVIVGGESGPNARPMLPEWATSLRDQCVAAKVPFFYKQWGEFLHVHPSELHLSTAPCVAVGPDGKPTPGGAIVLQRLGKKQAGRLLDGREWNQLPAA